MLDFRETSHEGVRSLEDGRYGCPFQRISGERHTRPQRLATVYHRLNEHHHPVAMGCLESTHVLKHQTGIPSTPLRES